MLEKDEKDDGVLRSEYDRETTPKSLATAVPPKSQVRSVKVKPRYTEERKDDVLVQQKVIEKKQSQNIQLSDID